MPAGKNSPETDIRNRVNSEYACWMLADGYVIVFNLADQRPPSAWPLVGMLTVASVGVVLVLWGRDIPSRLIGGVLAVVVAGMAVSDFLSAQNRFQFLQSLSRQELNVADGILRVAEVTPEIGDFYIDDRLFQHPPRVSEQVTFRLTRGMAARLDGRCVRALYTTSGEITWLAAPQGLPQTDNTTRC